MDDRKLDHLVEAHMNQKVVHVKEGHRYHWAEALGLTECLNRGSVAIHHILFLEELEVQMVFLGGHILALVDHR